MTSTANQLSRLESGGVGAGRTTPSGPAASATPVAGGPLARWWRLDLGGAASAVGAARLLGP